MQLSVGGAAVMIGFEDLKLLLLSLVRKHYMGHGVR